jgi:hypothetical protein
MKLVFKRLRLGEGVLDVEPDGSYTVTVEPKLEGDESLRLVQGSWRGDRSWADLSLFTGGSIHLNVHVNPREEK